MSIDFAKGILNFYKHNACKTHWADLWDCGCDDECPACGAAISPYVSLDVLDIEKKFKAQLRRALRD